MKMELDIFKRKLETRGFEFPHNEEGECLYKMFDLANKDFSIESTTLTDKKPVTLMLTRFVPNGMTERGNIKWDIQKIGETECKTLDDIVSFVDGIEKTLKGTPITPFDKILNEQQAHLRFIKKKEWVCKMVKA